MEEENNVPGENQESFEEQEQVQPDRQEEYGGGFDYQNYGDYGGQSRFPGPRGPPGGPRGGWRGPR